MFGELTHADESATANHDRQGQAAHRWYRQMTHSNFSCMSLGSLADPLLMAQTTAGLSHQQHTLVPGH